MAENQRQVEQHQRQLDALIKFHPILSIVLKIAKTHDNKV